jgi:hypothetical protein
VSNPFIVGPPVRGEDLCGRDVELDRIVPALGSGAVVAVSGAPGAGLTSLALAVAGRLGRTGRAAVRLEMSEAEDADEAAGLLEWALEPPAEGEPARHHLLLDGLRREAAVEAALPLLRRTAGRRVGTLLLGASPRLPELAEVAADGRSEAEKRSTLTVALSPPPAAGWLPYVLERFLETDRWIGNEHVHRVLEVTGGVPRPTQAVLQALWDTTEKGGRVADGAVERALRAAVAREGAGYRRVLDGLTGNQRRVLRGLARQPAAAPFSGEFVAGQGLASPSSVQRALEALEARGLVVSPPGEQHPRPADPLLARWLGRGPGDAVDVVGSAGERA